MAARIELGERGLRLEWPELATAEALVAVCTLADGSRHVGARWKAAGGGFRAACGPLHLSLRHAERDGRAELELEAEADSRCEVTGVGVALRPQLAGEPPGWWIYNGYQSWDPADVVPVEGAQQHQSWWTAAVADREGRGIAAGSTSAERLATRLELREGELTVLEGAARGADPVVWRAAPGERLVLETLALAAAEQVWPALRRVAGSVTKEPKPVPVGWLSWYHYGPWVSPEEVLDNAAVLRRPPFEGLGYQVIQTDDGWQQAYGDWTTNSKFSPGLAEMAGEITAAGQVAGVWTAPFLVSAGADLASTAPESWFIPDPKGGGRLIDPVHVSFGPMYVLDARRPEVLEHLEKVFAGLYRDGIRYFKIDFLYAGAYAGLEAFRAGLEAIRRAVGDSYILACGAPLQPVVGIADGCRIGQDTATPIYDFESGRPVARIFGDEVLWISRNVACRHHLAGWFQLDPDVALVGANLTLGQARQLVTAVALSGGLFFASDDLTTLEPERLALLHNREVLELTGRPPAVPDWEPDSDSLASIWRQGSEVLAAFNWNGPARKLVIETAGEVAVRDLWSGELVEAGGQLLHLDLPESGVRLLKLEGGDRLRAWLE